MNSMTYGPAYEERIDKARIHGQLACLLALMRDGHWRSLSEIALSTGIPEASASSNLRHLRKARFGGYLVLKRRRTLQGGTWEYKLMTKGLA